MHRGFSPDVQEASDSGQGPNVCDGRRSARVCARRSAEFCASSTDNLVSKVIPLSNRERRDVPASLRRTIQDIADSKRPTGVVPSFSKAIEAVSGSVGPNEFYIQLDCLRTHRELNAESNRGLSAGTRNLGGYLVETSISEAIEEVLRPASVLVRAGYHSSKSTASSCVNKPRQGVVAITLKSFREGGRWVIDWLDHQPGNLSNVPILIHSKCKDIHSLSACTGVHKNLVPLSTPQARRSPTFF